MGNCLCLIFKKQNISKMNSIAIDLPVIEENITDSIFLNNYNLL